MPSMIRAVSNPCNKLRTNNMIGMAIRTALDLGIAIDKIVSNIMKAPQISSPARRFVTHQRSSRNATGEINQTSGVLPGPGNVGTHIRLAK